MRLSFLSFLLFALSFQTKAQGQLHHKWVLMSLDNLVTSTKKQVGDYIRVELNFDNDSTYHGHFCNDYHGKYKFNKDSSCFMLAPSQTKKLCMGLKDTESEIFRIFPLVNRYILKGQLLYLFSSDKKRLVFKMEG